jgi:hypothetical protein
MTDTRQMTDAEHAARLKTLVRDLNKAAAQANADGLSVHFSMLELTCMSGAWLEAVDISVQRPL